MDGKEKAQLLIKAIEGKAIASIRAQVEKLRDEAMAKHIQLTDEEGTAPGVDVSRSFRQHGMRIAFQTVLDLLDGES